MKTKKFFLLVLLFGFLLFVLFRAPSEDAALNDSAAFQEATKDTASSDVSSKVPASENEKTKGAVFSNRRTDGVKKDGSCCKERRQ